MQFHSFTTSVVPLILIAVPSKKEKLPLSVTHPELAKEADGCNPESFSKGSPNKLTWKCKVGHNRDARISNRAIKAYGCPICSGQQILSGFNDLATLNSEIASQAYGWDLLEVRGPMDGYLTQQWESAMLRMLKAKGADLSNGKIAGKFDGYSEAWSKSTFEVKSIKELMRLTEEFEEKK